MKVLILNSGLGTRMGALSAAQPKCMTEISSRETILSRQLRLIAEIGISDVIITTGYYDDVLENYCCNLNLSIDITFVKNELYEETNYIYSIYCAKEYLDDDVLLLHGDMVFETSVLDDLLASDMSTMTVSSTMQIPKKDFKAVIREGRIIAVGVEFFENVLAAQPMYKLTRKDMDIWMAEIIRFCERDERACYAEKALNRVTDQMRLLPLDVKDRLCNEVDTLEDLEQVAKHLQETENRTVYMCFSTDVIHGGHIAIIRRAQKLGKLIIGVLSDEAVSTYKRYPLLEYEDRKTMIGGIAGVYKVVRQSKLSYRENLEELKPDYVVHGDDWNAGFQKPIRDEVVRILDTYGGELVEFPYATDERFRKIEARAKAELSMPDARRKRLKRELALKGLITAMEAHDGLTGLIVENTIVHKEGGGHQFDAMWISSLCDSIIKGKPDIELVDLTSRFQTVEDIMEVTTKPIIFDGDTGGKTEHFVYTVRTLERIGVSMIIIEDKTGLKKNSLFGTEVEQTQDSIENFCEKIKAGKNAQRTTDFMICARIESLILERGMEDALERARAYVSAGADAIMIHSRQKEPDEIFQFVETFRQHDMTTPIVVVPTSFNTVTEEDFKKKGANVVIYANQLIRAAVPAVQKVAASILTTHRSAECDDFLMPFSEIIRLIPEEM